VLKGEKGKRGEIRQRTLRGKNLTRRSPGGGKTIIIAKSGSFMRDVREDSVMAGNREMSTYTISKWEEELKGGL